MRNIYKNFKLDPLKIISFSILFAVILLSIGFSAFQNNLHVGDLGAAVRIKADIRITGVASMNPISDAISGYDEYNVSSISSGVTLPNSDSKITYEVKVTNFGNARMALAGINGLPSNLKYSIDEQNYKLKDVICDDNNSSKCTLGSVKTLYVTVEYADGGYDPNNTLYELNLDFDFRRVFSITYEDITNNNYPSQILENDTLVITFINDVPNNISATGLSSYSYESPTLTISNPTDDVVISGVIYSKHYDQLVFDGTNYVNTGIYLFNEENIDKNFEISFDLVSVDSNQNSQATLLNAMKEISPYPGFVFRVQSNGTQFEFNSPKIKTKGGIKIDTTQKILIKRLNDIYYIQVNGGNMEKLGTYSGTTFDLPLIIGASIDSNGNGQRYFKGTLANVDIKVTDPARYTVNFDANGGTGSMPDQSIREDETTTLSPCLFEKEGEMFDGWNTKADGSGTHYNDGQSVTNLAAPGETITLYATWAEPVTYYVRFNANGGTGSMNNQELVYGTSQNLSSNTFTNTGKIFGGWNTKADGSGTSYKDRQSVKNLTKTENDIIDLYAVWLDKSYSYSGEYEFTGSNYINTNIYLFNEATVNKDFELSFEIVDRQATSGQATMMSAMDESGKPWPGIVYRVQSATYDQLGANVTDTLKVEANYPRADVTKVAMKRVSGILYLSLNDDAYSQILDMTSLAKTFDVPLTFGASLTSNGSPQRYFKGTLKNMSVTIYD